ncbi:MAG TPA: hypothetical protein VH475_13145 [Tepidisphaeraceae bacterium]|jgi:hypothetical protein
MVEKRITADDVVRRIGRLLAVSDEELRLGSNSASTVITAPGKGVGFKNPMTASGDLIQGGTSGAATRLGVGATGQVLTVVSGKAAWADATGGGGGQYRSPVYVTYAGGQLVFNGAGHLVYVLENLE